MSLKKRESSGLRSRREGSTTGAAVEEEMDTPDRAIVMVPRWLNMKFSNRMTWLESSEISRVLISAIQTKVRNGKFSSSIVLFSMCIAS